MQASPLMQRNTQTPTMRSRPTGISAASAAYECEVDSLVGVTVVVSWLAYKPSGKFRSAVVLK